MKSGKRLISSKKSYSLFKTKDIGKPIKPKEKKEYNTSEVLSDLSNYVKQKKINLYVVGGYVRDNILGIPSKDIDLTIEGNGIELSKEIARNFGLREPVIFQNYGTAQLKFGNIEVEIVGTRSESYEKSSFKPAVAKGTLKDDLLRRDFTINTLAINLRTGKLIDITGQGLEDLKKGVIRTPLHPDITFQDDPTRMMRAIRFASKLNFQIESDTFESIKRNAKEIQRIPIEKIREEFSKILISDYPRKGIEAMRDSLLMEELLPEYSGLSSIQQEAKFHQYNLEGHTLITLQKAEKTLIDRLSAFLHDFGKKYTQTIEKGTIRFLQHEEKIEEIESILKRFKYPNDITETVLKVIRLHMRPHFLFKEYKQGTLPDKSIRKFIRDCGDTLENVMNLYVSDRAGHKGFLEEEKDIEQFKEMVLAYPLREEVQAITHPLNAFEIAEILHYPQPTEKEWNVNIAKKVQEIKDLLLNKMITGEIKDKEEAINYLKETF